MKRLDDYLQRESERVQKSRTDLQFLQGIKIPLSIVDDGDGRIWLYSDDYSLAEDFRVKKKSKEIEHGSSTPGGSFGTRRVILYLQFFFYVKAAGRKKEVLIEHPGYENDKRILIRSVREKWGYGDYSDYNSRQNEYVEVEKTLEFFRRKGVPEKLLEKLARTVKGIEELTI